VEEAFQALSRRVEVNLKNGEKLVAVEPKIDQIMLLAEEATPRCGEIIISTE
jgi:small nuclear ribonucleoprotein (snRNP)-like protein